MASCRRGARLTIREIFVLLFLMYWVEAQNSPSQKPHIIMIVADDLGWDDVSFHGSPQIPTPTLDGLANSGVILNNYYVSPMDSPTRAAFLTGKYALNLGLQHDTIHNKQPVGVPLTETLLPEYLRQLGYTTHAVGKWQLGFFAKEFTPTFRGFNSFYGFWTSGQDYFSHVTHDGNFGLDLRRNLDVVFNETGTYGTDLFTREADKVINEHDGRKPLFLYFAQQAVHVGNDNDPLQAPKKYLDRLGYITDERRRTYAAMVSALDESVRQLVTSLKRKGLYDNSIIIFTTDNGAAAGGLDGSAGSNYPLRGVKNTLWEGGVRAVGFVHSPLLKKRGRVSSAMIHASDWLPTFYALAGGDVSHLGTIDGFNVWESISNDAQSPRYEILHGLDSLREKKAALRVGDYKMIVHQNRSFYGDWYPRSEALHELDKVPKPKVLKEATVDCTVRHPHPLLYTKAPICNPERKPCLFNIKWDPCEYHNLADFMPNTLKVMIDRLKFYYYKAKPALYPQADESANPNLHGGIWSPWRERPDIEQTMNDYVYPNSYYDTLKTSFKPLEDHKPNESMTGQSSSASGTDQFAPKVASPFHPPSDVQSIIMNAGDFKLRQDSVSPATPATLATTATRATTASTAKVAITQPPTTPTTATIASTASPLIQKSSAPPAQAVKAVHGNVQLTTFPTAAATFGTEATANTLATTASTASPITKAPAAPSIPPAIVEKNKVADVVNYRAQRPSPFRPTGFLKGFFQHQVAGFIPTTPPVSKHLGGGARLVPETVNEVEHMVKGPTTVHSHPLSITGTKPVKFPGSFTVPKAVKQLMRNRFLPTKQGSSHVPSDVENVIRQHGFTKHLPSSEVEEISTLPLHPPPIKLTHKPYPHGLKGSIFGTHSNQLNSLPEILDIIDESTVPSAYETGSGQRQIPKIFDIIDEAHNLGEKVKEFSSHREGPIATSKPLTSNDVGSGMGVGLNGLPQGISVFSKLGDEKVLTTSHDTEGKGREHIVAKEKPRKGKKTPTTHKFIGNITIDGRHFYVVGTESEELESISTQLEGNKITLHLPKGKKTHNRKSKDKNKSPESAESKSEIGGVAFNTKPSYSEITDYIDEDEDNTERPVNKTLAAHNVTAVATAGNNTKCEKVVQLDTSDNAVVVSSVVIVVIASAMVVGVAVVAMVAVVARHCQNARN